MSVEIRKFATQRGIQKLVHFTRAVNLPSIAAHGLLTRDRVVQIAGADACNDQLRIDGTTAVCASIEWPNYKMFWGMRKDHDPAKWVVLALQPAVLWETRAAFCTTNAASNGVTAIPLGQRMSLQAFAGMYSDFGCVQRAGLKLRDSVPTNPQAEVLLLDGVPRKYIIGGWTLNETDRAEMSELVPSMEFKKNAAIFRYRHDFENWK